MVVFGGILKKNFKAISFLLMVFFCNAIILNSNVSTYADYSISMTSSGAQNIDVMPNYNHIGTSISEDNITITTTCPSGYVLTATTSVNNNNLYLNGNINNNASGTYFIPSNGATALNSSANTWGYYYNASNPVPTSSSIFKPIPTLGSTATTIKASSNTTDTFSIYYGVAVGNGLAPGSYRMIKDDNNANGTIIYYLTMSKACLPYTVVFNPTSTAGGTTLSGTGSMSNQSIPIDTATNLNTITYTAPAGYEFDSWNTKQDGTGITYSGGQSVTNLTTGGNIITLYAQWKVPCTSMQSVSDSTLATLMPNEGDSTTLCDSRDNKSYTVARIGDNYVMTQDLAITGTIPAEGSNFTGSDITPDYTSYDKLTSDNINKKIIINNSYGTYYNFCIATAGTLCEGYDIWTESEADICPSNWSIPTRIGWNEIADSTNATTYFNAQTGGYMNSRNSTPTEPSEVYYLSTTISDSMWVGGENVVPYVLSLDVDWEEDDPTDEEFIQVMSTTAITRYGGARIRCKKAVPCSTNTLSGYMQDVERASCYADGASGTLTDRRDNQQYTVKKINGALWMTKNLAIGCNGSGNTYGSSINSKVLKNSDSNVESNWSTPTALLSASSSSTQTADYSTPRMQCNSTYGAYYNYAAVSAGTIVGENNSSDAKNDICPKGWVLPKDSSSDGYGKISGTTYVSDFNAQKSGKYTNGSLSTSEGRWWTSEYSNYSSSSSYYQKVMYAYTFDGTKLYGYAGPLYRYQGATIRCTDKKHWY